MSIPGKSSKPDPTTEAILRHWREAVPDDRLAHLVRDAARGLTRALQLRLSEYSISFGHWVFLRILWEGDGISQRELSVRAGLMEPTTHAAILKMEALGYVTRRRREGNRKKLFIYLTDEGRALKDRLVPLAEEVNRVAVDGVPQPDVETTRGTLLAIIANLAADEERALEGGMRIPATRDLGRICPPDTPKDPAEMD
jgi:DNA-binding MarR family transcriptional regulator